MQEFQMQPVPIAEVLDLAVVPANLYVRISADRYVLAGKAQQPLRKDSFVTYQNKGLKHIFVSLEEYSALWPAQEIGRCDYFIRSLSRVYEELASCQLPGTRVLDAKRFQHYSLGVCLKHSELIETLSRVQALNPTEVRHGLMVGHWAVMIARNLPEIQSGDLQKLCLAGLLHDIGKLKLPSEIGIQKSDRLEGDSRVIYFNHATLGRSLFADLKFLDPLICTWAEQHHEHLDGSGLPMGLRSAQIHALSPVMALANHFADSLANRTGPPSHQTLTEIFSTVAEAKEQYGEHNLVALQHLIHKESTGAAA